MWSLFVGVAIGVLQVVALRGLGKWLLGEHSAKRLLAGVLLLLKIALIVAALYLISTISLTHLIWTAAGMALGLIATIAIVVWHRRPER